MLKNFKDTNQRSIKTYFMQEYALQNILFFGGYNINASHNFKDLNKVIKISEKILHKLNKENCNIKKFLIAKPAKPILKIRN